MNLNPPRKVRVLIYLASLVLSPVMTYLLAKGVIGDLEMALWSAEVSVAFGLAALNTGAQVEPRNEVGRVTLELVLVIVGVVFLLALVLALAGVIDLRILT